MSALEELLVLHLHAAQLPPPQREWRFSPPRRWRFDLAWPDRLIAVEVEGGVWTRGRHTRAGGYAKDCEKHNAAALAGWTLLRFTGDMVRDGSALMVIEQALR